MTRNRAPRDAPAPCAVLCTVCSLQAKDMTGFDARPVPPAIMARTQLHRDTALKHDTVPNEVRMHAYKHACALGRHSLILCASRVARAVPKGVHTPARSTTCSPWAGSTPGANSQPSSTVTEGFKSWCLQV